MINIVFPNGIFPIIHFLKILLDRKNLWLDQRALQLSHKNKNINDDGQCCPSSFLLVESFVTNVILLLDHLETDIRSSVHCTMLFSIILYNRFATSITYCNNTICIDTVHHKIFLNSISSRF